MGQGLLKNISIKHKLLFVVIVPVLAILVLAGVRIYALQSETKSHVDTSKLMEVSIAANNFVHELQKERGFSAGFIGSKGKNFTDALSKQRKVTDKKRADFTVVYSSVDIERFGKKYNEVLSKALDDLGRIEEVRKSVDGLNMPLGKVVGYYTHMNADFLAINGSALFIVKDPDVLRDVSTYLGFLQSKERAGIERAVGAVGFSKGWNVSLSSRLLNLITVQDTYLDVFETYATDEELEFYHKKIKDESFVKTQKMRDIALSGKTDTSVDANEWFVTLTHKINILKDIENHLAEDVLHISTEHAARSFTERNIYVLVFGILLIIIYFMTSTIIKDLLGGIKSTEGIMTALSQGNVGTEIRGGERRDEIGAMARSLEILKQGLIEKSNLEEEALKAQARAKQESSQMIMGFAESFDSQVGGLIDSLTASSTELQGTAEGMRSVADETSQASQTVAASSEEASANVNTVAAAMEEMAASSGAISMQITAAKNKSNDMTVDAHEANETVGNLSSLVEGIGEVVVAIQDIAEQTNLLALNATIEAARAGDAGKGFAVVADEVKKLATETAQKTEEINARINEIQGATDASVLAMGRIISNISDIDQSITGVSAAVEEQNATTSEIVRSVSEASMGVQNVSQIIVEVQRGAGETGSSANAVLDAAKQVSNLSGELKGAVDQFLNQIKADDVA
ncbi:MAG: hypothetical protein COB14_01985 [Alphaproteobacteria bacterium]|nr:MAG: hypothetical protein COB14_01985 [Alphaproteobacteria bacterium]